MVNKRKIFNAESAMGCKMNAQSGESEYIKSVKRLSLEEANIKYLFRFSF